MFRWLLSRKVPVLFLAEHHPVVRRWPNYGRIAQVIRSENTAYEVNEYGDWSSIGRQTSERESARRHFAKLTDQLRHAEEVAAALRADLDTLLTHYPGCDKPNPYPVEGKKS